MGGSANRWSYLNSLISCTLATLTLTIFGPRCLFDCLFCSHLVMDLALLVGALSVSFLNSNFCITCFWSKFPLGMGFSHINIETVE